jgi:hypothetical protein
MKGFLICLMLRYRVPQEGRKYEAKIYREVGMISQDRIVGLNFQKREI